jgi:predicted nucleic acid-binding protein
MDIKKKYLLLDTCIVQDTGDRNESKSNAVLSYFEHLSKSYDLAISEITVFENLQGLWDVKANQALAHLKTYEWKEVTDKVLILAASLGGLYKGSSLTIETGDKIIASTAILLDAHILTRNYNDFPSPFFVQYSWYPISFQVGHYTRTIDYIIYEPNKDIIKRRFSDNEEKQNKSG